MREPWNGFIIGGLIGILCLMVGLDFKEFLVVLIVLFIGYKLGKQDCSKSIKNKKK